MSASTSTPVGDTTVEPGLSRRTLIRRAAVVGAAAWTAPMLIDSVTSPAAAASCTMRTLDWNTLAVGAGGTTTCTGRRGTPPCGTTTYTPPAVGGVTVAFSVSALSGTTLLTPASNGGNGNLTVRAAPNGGLSTQALQLQMLPDSTTIGQVVTLTFSQAVTNVTLTLFDIDNSVGGWGDRISFSPVPTTVTTTDSGWTPTSSTVTGAGTVANPLMNSSTNTNFADTSSLGNVTLTFAGPVSSVALTYTNAVNTGGSNMRIGISNISFCS